MLVARLLKHQFYIANNRTIVHMVAAGVFSQLWVYQMMLPCCPVSLTSVLYYGTQFSSCHLDKEHISVHLVAIRIDFPNVKF